MRFFSLQENDALGQEVLSRLERAATSSEVDRVHSYLQVRTRNHKFDYYFKIHIFVHRRWSR